MRPPVRCVMICSNWTPTFIAFVAYKALPDGAQEWLDMRLKKAYTHSPLHGGVYFEDDQEAWLFYDQFAHNYTELC